MRFFTYNQNSVGGQWDVDNNVAHYVIIQADSEDSADKIMDSISYNDSCDCCGYRWQGVEDDYDVPSIWDTPVNDYFTTFGDIKQYRIHYTDGTIVSGIIPKKS